MSEDIICNTFRDIAIGRLNEIPEDAKGLINAVASGPPRTDSLYYMCTELVRNRFQLNQRGKTFALYASRSESLSICIDYRPRGSQAVSSVPFTTFQAYGVNDIDWAYTPKDPLAADLEFQLWDRWLSHPQAASIPETERHLFQNAFRAVGASLLFAIRMQQHEKMQELDDDVSVNTFGPWYCLESLKEKFPALFTAQKDSDISRTAAAMAELRNLVSDFDLNDVVFGKHYEYSVADTQEKFNELYIRVLVSRVFLPSYPEAKMPSPEVAARLYGLQKSLDLDSFLKLLIEGEGEAEAEVVPSSRSTWVPLVTERQQAQFASTMFVKLLRTKANEYHDTLEGRGTIYSPYVPVCNSSGVGKTRLALSTGYSCITILICLRPESETTAYPPRSLIYKHVMDKMIFTSPYVMGLFLLACLEVWVEVFEDWIRCKEGITKQYQAFYRSEETNFLKIMCDLIAFNTAELKAPDRTTDGVSLSYHQIYWTKVEEKHKNFIIRPPPNSAAPSKSESSTVQRTSSIPSKRTAAQSESKSSEKAATSGASSSNVKAIDKDTGLATTEEIPIELIPCFKDANNAAQSLLRQHKLLRAKEVALIVPVFDEARNLLPAQASDYPSSLFRYLRLGCIVMCNTIVLLTDTLSTVWNFTPPMRFENSAKHILTRDVFPPIISIPMLNVVKCQRLPAVPFRATASRGFTSLDYDPFNDIDMSRPMYPAKFNQELNGLADSNIRVARQKVLSLADFKFRGSINNQSVSASVFDAILVAKLGVPFLSSVTNSKLMASHMGLATFISEDREDVVVSYQGEPMASQGATSVLWASGHLSKTVNCLYNSLSTQALVQSDVGGVGEILAAFYCVLAQDKCLSKQYKDAAGTVVDYLRPRLCKHFLSLLLPQSSLKFLGDNYTVNGILMNSFVTFACFVPMLKPLSSNPQFLVTKPYLLWALESRVAFYLPPNTEGIDLVIPVIPGAKRNTPLTMNLDNVGAIVIQVKNHAKYPSKDDLEVIMGKMREASCLFEPGVSILLGILMNVGSGGLGSENTRARNNFFLLENTTVEGSFPIVSVSGTMMQNAIVLDESIQGVLKKICQIPSGPEDQVWRTYHSRTISPTNITDLTCHIHPQYRLRLP